MPSASKKTKSHIVTSANIYRALNTCENCALCITCVPGVADASSWLLNCSCCAGSFGCFVAVIVVFIVGFVCLVAVIKCVVVLSEENIQDLPKLNKFKSLSMRKRACTGKR